MMPIRNLISGSLHRAGIVTQLTASQVVDEAQKVFDNFFKQHKCDVKVMNFKSGTLTISCVSSIFAHEIKLNESNILGVINCALSKKIVERIRYLL